MSGLKRKGCSWRLLITRTFPYRDLPDRVCVEPAHLLGLTHALDRGVAHAPPFRELALAVSALFYLLLKLISGHGVCEGALSERKKRPVPADAEAGRCMLVVESDDELIPAYLFGVHPYREHVGGGVIFDGLQGLFFADVGNDSSFCSSLNRVMHDF